MATASKIKSRLLTHIHSFFSPRNEQVAKTRAADHAQNTAARRRLTYLLLLQPVRLQAPNEKMRSLCCCCFQSVTGRLQQQQGSHLALAFLRVFYRQLAEMIYRKEADWLLLETWTMDWKGFKRELGKTEVLLAITVCLMRVFLVW